MQIEQIRLRNFRVFRECHIRQIPCLAVFLGANGVGKSTLFDAIGFLTDSLLHNVRHAVSKRGGFDEVRSRDSDGPIEIELKFREDTDNPLVTYELHVDQDRRGRPIVAREVLKYRRGGSGKPWHFLDFRNGSGHAVVNEEDYGKVDAREQREEQQLESPDILAIKGLGQLAKFPRAAAFRRLIEHWHVSDFHISEARPSQESGLAEHLSHRGDNLPLVAQYMFEQHRDVFDKVLAKMARRVPGVSKVQAASTEDGRIVLKFQDDKFKDPFIARYVSDGTIKMFAYLLLLHDPSPHPLLCVEEPENQLYPTLLIELAEEFREYAVRGGQVFVSTHSPDFLNGVRLNEIFVLVKKDGYTDIRKASDDPRLVELVAAGDPPGALWKQRLFAGADP